MRDNPSNVAIYWDFENLQASLVEKKGGNGAYGRTKYQAQEALIDIESVMEFAATFGVVSINRAYCNWQWYGKYREALLHNGLELIQLFHPGASGKNGGDIKLCLDCTEDLLRFPQIDVVVIVGGDSDYLPLVQKIKAQGKMLVGIGVQANTNRHWAHSCHEFKFYEALILDDEPIQAQIPYVPAGNGNGGQNPNGPASPQGSTAPNPLPVPSSQNHRPNAESDNVVQARPEELLRRAILRLAGKSGDSWVLKGSIRPMMKRLDPTFEEEQHGVKTFSSFMKKFESVLEVRAGRNDQEVRLRDRTRGAAERPSEPDRTGDRNQERGSDNRRERDRDRNRHRDSGTSERRPEQPVPEGISAPGPVDPVAPDPVDALVVAPPEPETTQAPESTETVQTESVPSAPEGVPAESSAEPTGRKPAGTGKGRRPPAKKAAPKPRTPGKRTGE